VRDAARECCNLLLLLCHARPCQNHQVTHRRTKVQGLCALSGTLFVTYRTFVRSGPPTGRCSRTRPNGRSESDTALRSRSYASTAAATLPNISQQYLKVLIRGNDASPSAMAVPANANYRRLGSLVGTYCCGADTASLHSQSQRRSAIIIRTCLLETLLFSTMCEHLCTSSSTSVRTAHCVEVSCAPNLQL
jgi:hypothetical protein